MYINIRNLKPELVEHIERLKKDYYWCNTNISAVKYMIGNYFGLLDEISMLRKDNNLMRAKIESIDGAMKVLGMNFDHESFESDFEERESGFNKYFKS